MHPSTIKAWHRAGLLTSHKANDKNERLFDPPDPDDPRLNARKAGACKTENPPHHPDEVHYETNAFACGSPARG